jgi:hypothetical protein
MIGEVFEVYEVDEYGYPWVRKTWPVPGRGKSYSHSIALRPHEIEVVTDDAR